MLYTILIIGLVIVTIGHFFTPEGKGFRIGCIGITILILITIFLYWFFTRNDGVKIYSLPDKKSKILNNFKNDVTITPYCKTRINNITFYNVLVQDLKGNGIYQNAFVDSIELAEYKGLLKRYSSMEEIMDCGGTYGKFILNNENNSE